MRYSFLLPRSGRTEIERKTKKGVWRSEDGAGYRERGERERRRENATKGLMKREDGEEEASIKQNGAGAARARRRGQTERIDDRTNKDRGIGRGRDGCHRESGASAMPREASAWLNFLLNYYFNRKDERR